MRCQRAFGNHCIHSLLLSGLRLLLLQTLVLLLVLKHFLLPYPTLDSYNSQSTYWRSR